ncbi:TRAP transporter substrate-binding protein DctP [Virgibacillus sp. C22-A2]|uniref:TRAP transporter substrate-binding protein DctP n=1 Tax=Virgibacillus tibetensis TaxID=3042313 RepID=A0ABU6KHM3_9BACI|nr:TRAP transporter substrate-binding protein DctP [Virgibacillus sp. C22-A2]
MKKNSVVIVTIIVAVLVLASCGKEGSTSGKEVYEFDFNVQAPPNHKFNTDTVEPWAEFVEEETNGRIKINVFSSGALGAYETSLQDIKGGVYDIGYANPSLQRDTELFPLTIGELPFAINDSFKGRKILEQFNEKYVSDSYEGTTFMSVVSSDSYQLVSKKPVESFSDVEGKKINAIGNERADLVDAWGGAPVTLGLSQMYEALERGTVDQVIYLGIGAVGYKLFEVAPNLTKLDMGAMNFVYMVNSQSLDQLPEDLRETFLEKLSPKLAELTAEMYTNEEQKAFEEFEAQGGNVTTLENKDLQEFKDSSEVVWENWVEEANKKGYPGEEMMNYFKELLEEEEMDIPFE